MFTPLISVVVIKSGLGQRLNGIQASHPQGTSAASAGALNVASICSHLHPAQLLCLSKPWTTACRMLARLACQIWKRVTMWSICLLLRKQQCEDQKFKATLSHTASSVRNPPSRAILFWDPPYPHIRPTRTFCWSISNWCGHEYTFLKFVVSTISSESRSFGETTLVKNYIMF